MAEPLFKCRSCGGTRMAIPIPPENPPPTYMLKCRDCGTDFEEWGVFRAKAMQRAKAQVAAKHGKLPGESEH